MNAKVDYVKSQSQTRKHHCHWPGCNKQVPPAMWGCSPHWYALPMALRNRIWATYRPGQEVTGTPDAKYIEVARAVQDWIRENAAKVNEAKTTKAGASPAHGGANRSPSAGAASDGQLGFQFEAEPAAPSAVTSEA